MNSEQKSYISNTLFLLKNTGWFSEDVALFLACLSALETGYGTSVAYLTYSNLFGMSHAVVRPTCGVKLAGKDYAGFECELDCVSDFAVWCAWNGIRQKSLHDADLFLTAMSNTGYNPRKSYYPTIVKIYNEYLSSDKELSSKYKPLSY